MKVLLLHPEDQIGAAASRRHWDLVVDLGRAPQSTYERWSRQIGCPVRSLYEFSHGMGDLRLLRELLHLGRDRLVDRVGIDWWDVLSLMIESELRQVLWAGRLARELKPGCELHASRPTALCTALQTWAGAKRISGQTGLGSVVRWARHYGRVFSHLDAAQIAQVFQDRFDREHRMRRHLVRGRRKSPHGVVLLPSAYINVSRTAVSYAALLPDEQFLLVFARNSAQLKTLPANVSITSLDPYFVPADPDEAADLMRSWESLKKYLVGAAQEFSAANAAGLLNRLPGLLQWGVAVRDAWSQVLSSEPVTACLCADNSNPYTRIPLILASRRGIPTLACHHGAFDSKMALKGLQGDVYLAKGEIERDYLMHSCGVPRERIVLGGTGLAASEGPARPAESAARGEGWLAFFTEPYQAAGWRLDEVYAELLPSLWALARSCGLKLVFKLHPFESVKGHRRILRRHLPSHAEEIGVIDGAPSAHLWTHTRLALTVQSTLALQCSNLGIPVFLCPWLRDSTTGYLEQFAKFGIGQALQSKEELDRIPDLLRRREKATPVAQAAWRAMDPGLLRDLLVRSDRLSEALKA